MVSGLVFGIATLVVAIIIAFVVVSNAITVNDDIYFTGEGPSGSNESITGLAEAGDDLDAAYLSGASCTVSEVYNETNDDLILAEDNYTVSGCTISGVAESPYLGYDVQVTYTSTYHKTSESGDRMFENFTEGVDEISEQVPTVLLVSAIILILAILSTLIVVWQRMRVGGSI